MATSNNLGNITKSIFSKISPITRDPITRDPSPMSPINLNSPMSPMSSMDQSTPSNTSIWVIGLIVILVLGLGFVIYKYVIVGRLFSNTNTSTITNNLSQLKQQLSSKINQTLTVNPDNANALTDSNPNPNPNPNSDSEEPEPVRSQTQSQGYCYVGKINDTRYCAQVSSRDYCMSGDIYPSMDICVNPNLKSTK